LKVGKIAGERQLASARVGGAVDGGNHGNGTGHDRPHHALEHAVLDQPGVVGHAAPLLEVGAGAEDAVAGAGQHHRAASDGSSSKAWKASVSSCPIRVLRELATAGRFRVI